MFRYLAGAVASVGAGTRETGSEALDVASFVRQGTRALGQYRPSARRSALRTLTRQIRFTIGGATPLIVALR